MSVGSAASQLGSLAAEAAAAGERVTLTEAGVPVAVLIGPLELAELEERAAASSYRQRRDQGAVAVVRHDEVRKRLGLLRG